MTGYLTFNWVSQGFRCNGLRFSSNCRCSQLANLASSGNVLVYNNPGTTTNHECFWNSISLQYFSLGSVLSHATKEVTRMRKIRVAQGALWQYSNKPGGLDCEQSLIFLCKVTARNLSTRASKPLAARNEGVKSQSLYNNIVVCNRAGWDKNQTDFKRKGGLNKSTGEQKKYSGSWVGYTGCSRITWPPRLGY